MLTTNTLVRHKKLTSLGIGCIAKVLPKTYMVNFGTEDCVKLKENELILVDTSKCKTISFQEFRVKGMNNSFKSDSVRMIVGNLLQEYVGIGWITKGVVTDEDLQKYTRVI